MNLNWALGEIFVVLFRQGNQPHIAYIFSICQESELEECWLGLVSSMELMYFKKPQLNIKCSNSTG